MARAVKLRVAAWVLGGILAVLVLLVALLHTPPVRRYALKKAIEILDKQNIKIAARDLNYNLLELEATLNELTVASTMAPELPPILRADHATVDLSLRTILRGEIAIENARVDNPQVHLLIDEQGKDNLPHPPEKEEKTKSETNYLIDQALVQGGNVRFEDRRQKLDVLLPLDRISIDGNAATGNHQVELLTKDGGRVAFENRSQPIHGVTASAVLGQDSVDVQSFRLGLGKSTLAFSGTVQEFSDPRFDVRANSTLALGGLTELAGLKQSVAGTVDVQIAARGPMKSLEATARVQGDDLAVADFKNLDLNAEAAYNAGTSRVNVRSLNLTAPVGTVRGQANLALNADAGQSTANITARGVDLGSITSTLDAPVRVASRANAEVEARWPALEYEQAAGNATLNLAATRESAAKDVLPVSGSVDVKTAGDRIVVGIPELRTLDAAASGQITLANRRTLDGNLRLVAADLGQTITGAEAYLGRDIVTTPVSGSAEIIADLGGTLQAPTASAKLAAPDLNVGDLQDIGVHAAVDYNPNLLTVEGATIDWRGESLDASGTVGLKGRVRSLNLTAHSDKIQVGTILAALKEEDIPASGTFAFDAKVGGTTDQPQANVQLTGTDLAAYNEAFGQLTTQARVDGDLITLDELRLNKPQPEGDGSLQASGTFHLKTKDYTVRAESNNFNLTSMQLPSGQAVRGELNLNVTGQGNIDNPSGQLKLAAQNLQIGDQAYGDVNLAANVADKTAQIDAALPKLNVAAEGTIGLDAPYPADLRVQAQNTTVESLPVKIEQPLSGSATASLHVKGNLSDLQQADATAEISSLNLEWNGQPFRIDGPMVAHYDQKRLDLKNATVVAGDSRLSVTGTMPLDPAAGAGSIKVEGTIDLASASRYVPSEKEIIARGIVTLAGTVTGTLKSLDPDLTLAVDEGYFATADAPYAVSRINVKAEVQKGGFELTSASANYGPATFTASGTVPLGLLPANLPVDFVRRQGPAQLNASLNDLDLGNLEQLPDEAGGRISANLQVTAPRPELEAVTGQLTFPQLRVTYQNYFLEQQGTTAIEFANGTARVQNLMLTGPETKIQVAGTAGLTGQKALDLKVDGTINAAVASAFVEDVQSAGDTEIRVALSGTASQPQATGFVQLANGQFSVRDPQIGAENVNLRLEFAGTRATLTQLNGELNGGDLSGSGTIEYANGAFRNTNLNIKAKDVFIQAPADLRTVSDVDLQLTSKENNLIVGGQVTIQDGSYTDDIHIGSELMRRLSQPRSVDLTEERSPLVERVQFNLAIDTANPILLDNNFGEAAIEADLRLLGTPYEPGLSGRLLIEEGGVLRLQEREYAIERGVITFTNERRIEPSLDILATTSVEGYDISLNITGEPGDTETALTSDPPLGEPDIFALLLTGKRADEMRGEEFEIARNQVLSYLTGSVGSRIGSGISGATGLSTVRIEPNLIAAETDPSARLTVGQDITNNLELVYSMDLINSSDQIYMVEYDLSRRFSTRGIRQSDGSYRFDFQHDLQFGGVPGPRRGRKTEERRIGNVNIVGEQYFSQMKIADKFDVKEGNRYNFFKVRKGLDRLEKMYSKANLLESRVRLNREERGELVDLGLNVRPGPVLDFVYEGISVPGGVQKDIRDIWQRGVFDTQRAGEAVDRLRRWLVKDNYLQPKIDYKITTPSEGHKRVVFDVQEGVQFHDVEIAFAGNSDVESDTLRDIIDKQDLKTDVYVDPSEVTDLLTRYYREQGYLVAEVESPRLELDAQARTGRVVFPVNEGPLFRIANVEFNGNQIFSDEELLNRVPLPKGEPYKPVLRENSLDLLRAHYWDYGFNDVETEYTLRHDRDRGTVDIVFNIAERRQSVVRDIVIEGRKNTSYNLVRSQIGLEIGDILDLAELSEARKNLYRTGAYSLVDIEREEIGTTGDDQTRARQSDEPAGERPMRLSVRVREVQPFALNYGAFFDTERGPGGILDISNRNSLGSARVLGLRARYDSQLREGRLYFSQPSLLRFPAKTIVSPYLRYERNPVTQESDPFNVDRVGFSIQQEWQLRDKYVLNYGYKIERTRTYDPSPDALFDIPIRIGSLTSALTRETRDEILDATRGSFISHALQYSPELLGSQLRFIKYFGQYFRYFPLEKPRVDLFTNKVERPRLVYATAIRVGLATGFGGQEVPLSERFFAGGSTTIRGFEQNTVGEIGPDRIPLGGEAMLVLNNEIRFPLISIFDGVGFVDIGNVYPQVSDFSFSDIRKTTGIGIRVRTPWFLLRADYGLKLDRQPGETRGRFYFSIGQAF